MKITEKDIGRRCLVNGECDEESFENEPGKIVGIDKMENSPIAVYFDKPRHNRFHTCSRLAKRGHGFWVREDMITFLDEDSKMEDMDIQVGDPVQCVLYGDGVIKSINSDEYDGFPVEVFFKAKERSEFYSLQGQFYGDSARCFYHAGSIKREGSKIIIDPVKPVREKWVSIFLLPDGRPWIGGKYSSVQEALDAVDGYGLDYITTIQLKRSAHE